MRPLLPILLSTAAPLLAQVLAQPGATPEPYVEVDCQKLERRIGKEPAYVAEPRYALFVLDLAGRNRTWAVTDKSTRDAPFHDVLYLDLDADGDLTGPGERFVGQRDPNKAPAGLEMSFRIPELRVPGTALVHRSFLLSTSPKKDRSGFWFRMQWNGRHEVSGGYGATGIDTTAWATSAAKAPVLRPCPLGPLRFGTWGDDVIELRAGTAVKINVIAGNPGSGPDTLCVVDEHFLDLERDELLVTVLAVNARGQEVRETTRIREHC